MELSPANGGAALFRRLVRRVATLGRALFTRLRDALLGRLAVIEPAKVFAVPVLEISTALSASAW